MVIYKGRYLKGSSRTNMSNNKTIKQYLSNQDLDIDSIINEFTSYVFVIIRNSNYNFKEEDIEEIASDVFLTVWKNRSKLDMNKEISPYIAGITKNLILKKNREVKCENVNIEEFENYLYSENDISLQTDNKDRTILILKELENMSKEDKEIFTYYYYYSNAIKEISGKLEISERKVKSRLFRIRKKLKKVLEKRGYGYERQ